MMFGPEPRRSTISSALRVFALIYHSTVHSVRKAHRNAAVALMMNIAQTLILVLVFFVVFSLMGLRSAAIRGDFLLYIMSGIFLFMCHIKTVGAVVGAEGPTAAIMKHAPMTTAISVSAAGLGALYIQVLSLTVILFAYHVLWSPLTIHQPAGAFAMLLLAWFSGFAIGMVLLAVKPWFPGLVDITTQIYMRANIFASGKMFVANQMPGFLLPFFDWNPLFHIIDQARGFTFINYNPHFTSITYPVYVALACLMLGLMGEFYTRQRASFSWNARR